MMQLCDFEEFLFCFFTTEDGLASPTLGGGPMYVPAHLHNRVQDRAPTFVTVCDKKALFH